MLIAEDRARSLVLARTRPARPPAVPEIELLLADDMDAAWQSLQTELDDAALPPPFWAFAWLGGQALARHVLDVPAEVVGRRVLDLATGSGLCALAALSAGAAEVTAVDIDPVAVQAVRLNAERNGASATAPSATAPSATAPDSRSRSRTRSTGRRRTSTSSSRATSATTP